MTYPQPSVYMPADPEARRGGWVFVWIGACVATWLAIGLPLWLIFFA